jgi:hypothetical protein
MGPFSIKIEASHTAREAPTIYDGECQYFYHIIRFFWNADFSTSRSEFTKNAKA